MSSRVPSIASAMTREKISNLSKLTVIGAGAACVAASIFALPQQALTPGYLFIVLFGVVIAPRMTLSLPRSKFAISFGDALIFLTFLMYGGPAAIVLAAIEMVASCMYLRSNGFPFGRLMIPTNVSITAINTSATFLLWYTLPGLTGIQFNLAKTPDLISVLGILALSQFFVSATFASIFHAVKDGQSFWVTWRQDCFSSSMTQIVGAGLAALLYKLINYGDIVTSSIAFVALAAAYMNYRQSIGEITDAIGQVEEAERAKALTERERRVEAESHAAQLADSLVKEERANEALRKSEKAFQHAALHDSLTGLANRKNLWGVLSQMINDYKDDPAMSFQVLFIDVRSFKKINDMLGHSIGDKVLTIAAKRFLRMLEPDDIVARIGGDEFAIVLRDLSTAGKAQKVARRIYQNITQPFSLSGNKIQIDVNIGIAPCDAEYNTPEEILRDADIAMHYAKEKEDGFAVFTKELRFRFLEQIRFETDLRHALDREELSMHYQPIVSLSDGQLIGFEALLRWHRKDAGFIPPSKFIPVAEQSGLIQPITVWILRETCRQLAEWQKISPDYANMIVSVNISGKHLSNDDLIDDVENALADSGIRPETLKLEITESSAMENAEHTIGLLKRLKRIGVQLSIDDFGTGFSSLSYLQRLPFDTLKIDRSFVYTVGENGENSEILQTIISLAKSLRMRVIAEGIETESQLGVLRNLGCDYGQGYLLAKPKAKEETETLLYQHVNWLPNEVDPTPAYSDRPHQPEELRLH
ncbi:MAG TPA: bifunctional diguanylate cyclase/phosphodiesterase [Pyrinomonadaceae bacterium]|nr:bifunctional diguanylate cyclase/phosphodiesterase [Pyrinomonadaceae bacterium]